MAGYVSPRLGIRFDPGKGADDLRIFGPDGTQFLTFTEWVEKSKAEQRRADAAEERVLEHARLAMVDRKCADDERQRADDERQCADDERQRADEARQRVDDQTRIAIAAHQLAERLAARLREFGIEPE